MITKEEAVSQIRIMVMEATTYHTLHELYDRVGMQRMAAECLTLRNGLGHEIRKLAAQHSITLKEV